MKRKLAMALVVLLMLAVLPAAFAEDLTTTAMRVDKTVGDVHVTDSSGEPVDISKDARLLNGCTVETGESSYAWILLDDAKTCKMDAQTSVTLEKDNGAFTLTVNSGNLFFNVAEKLSEEETMHIQTATMGTEIRGTSGEISVTDNKETWLYLFDGMMTAQARNLDGTFSGEAITLHPGEAIAAVRVDVNTAEENPLVGGSMLTSVKPLNVADVSMSTLVEIYSDVNLQARMNPELVDAVFGVVQQPSLDPSEFGESNGHKHSYPSKMDRDYTWTPDYRYCTGSVKCADCDYILTETEHATYTVHQEPTCTTLGSYTYSVHFMSSAFQDVFETGTIAPLGHVWPTSFASFAWSEDNLSCTATRHCLRNYYHVESGSAIVTSGSIEKPGCETSGTISYTATAVFGADLYSSRKVVSGPALGHEWSEPIYVWSGVGTGSASLTDVSMAESGAGCTAISNCVRNDCVQTKSETAVSIASNVNKLPTCTDTGLIIYTASFESPLVPDAVKEEIVPRLPHLLAHMDELQATCSETGRTEFWYCENCDTRFSDPDGINEITSVPETQPLGHSFGTPSYQWEIQGTACSCIGTAACSRPGCTYAETETVSADSVTDRMPTCTTEGQITWTANFSKAPFAAQTMTVPAPVTDHSYGEPDYFWNDGICQASAVCAGCGHVIREEGTSVRSRVIDSETGDEYDAFIASFESDVFTAQTMILPPLPSD